jgi:AraC-like DNA-binding protein
MPVLPVPMIIALVLFGFLLQRLARRETHWTLLALIAVCALQSSIIALVHYYGLTAIRPLQPIMAMFIPPIAWMAFDWASGGTWLPRKLLWNGIGPLLALVCLALNPALLDVLIPLSFLTYGVAVLARLWRGEDSLPHSRLEGGAGPLWVWRIVGLSLVASAGGDVVIAVALAMGDPRVLLWLPSLASSISLLALGALSLSSSIESSREFDGQEPALSSEDIAREQAIVVRLDDYMAAQKPFLDPDLTLARLARKLVVPAKQLSAAINRSKSENVSRFINRHRIEHACSLIESGKNVTAAMFDSGFNTKSNFNREFLRIKNLPPSKWHAEQLS